MFEFRMPSLGADMEAGTVAEWRVAPGAAVRSGDVILVVETDKGAIEVEIFATGTVRSLCVEEGAKVPVGTVLAEIETAALPASETAPRVVAPVPAPPPPAPPLAAFGPLQRNFLVTQTNGGNQEAPGALAATSGGERGPPDRGVADVGEASSSTQNGRSAGPGALPDSVAGVARATRSSPSARRRARELNVDLGLTHGTGPHGAVRRADVERTAADRAPAAAPAPSPAAAPPASGANAAMRRAIAAAMSRSNREIPHYYLATDIDLRRALAWLTERNAARPIAERVLPAALLLRAVAVGLGRFPELNGSWVDDAHRPSADVHLSVAIALRGGGLVTPCIHSAQNLGMDALMAALNDLVARTRASRLRASELSDGTVTVTNLGDLGVDAVFGVIYPPQVALVGFGRVRDRPVAVDGMLGVHPVVCATLAADHRASDGHRGGLFLAALDHLLQEPENL